MPVRTIATPGTELQLSTTANKAARITMQRLASNTGVVYIGLPGPANTGSAVTSTAYDAYLDASNPSLTLGLGETHGDSLDASMIWLDVSVGGEGVAFFLEPI